VLVHFRPSLDFTPVYSHGFSPTVHRAHVTSNGGEAGRDLRVLKELTVRGGEPEPAALVYNKWAGGYFDEELGRIAAAKARGEVPALEVILGKSSEFPRTWRGSRLSKLHPDSRRQHHAPQAIVHRHTLLSGACWTPLCSDAVGVAGSPLNVAASQERPSDEIAEIERPRAKVERPPAESAAEAAAAEEASSSSAPLEDAFACSSSVLLHPAFIHDDLSITVFARAPVGTEVRICTPSPQHRQWKRGRQQSCMRTPC
jgi:hypothetical protein